MDILNIETLRSLDITKMVEQYRDKTIEELFPNHEIISNNLGQFMRISWEIEEIPCDMKLSITRKYLLSNLKAVTYIGENIEEYFYKRGIKNLIDLKQNLRFSPAANALLDLIKNKDYQSLSQNKYINDFHLLFCFHPEELLFIDIETLGIYDSPIIMIGIGFFLDKKFHIDILLARDLEEEIAICEHLKNEIFTKFKTFISYNGKTFDIPYIANRLLYFFDENPMISEKDVPYQDTNTIFHHIDLYHQCRRKFKGQFKEYTLNSIEQHLLNFKRENELPSNLVGVCYRKYLEDPHRYIGLLKHIIEHNFWDIYSLPLIMQNLLNL